MKIGGLREDILFKSKEYPLALPKKDCQGGWRRHKLHIPRRCPEGTGSLIPLLLLFPPQNFAVGALYFPLTTPLKRPKERPAGLSFGNLLGGGRGMGAGCLRSFRGFRLAADEIEEGLVVLASTLGG